MHVRGNRDDSSVVLSSNPGENGGMKNILYIAEGDMVRCIIGGALKNAVRLLNMQAEVYSLGMDAFVLQSSQFLTESLIIASKPRDTPLDVLIGMVRACTKTCLVVIDSSQPRDCVNENDNFYVTPESDLTKILQIVLRMRK